jgi:large subunit ribosomal protein L15
MNLNELSDNPGARKKRKRAGRGIGSGLGKTAGRGMKGQKSRSGVSLLGFEGGQMPLYRRLPKRGFHQPNRRKYQELTIFRLQAAIDKGTIDTENEITEEILKQSGVVRRIRDGVRLIGNNQLKSKIEIKITSATKSASESVKKAGGTITVIKKVSPEESDKEKNTVDGDNE